MDEVNGRKEQVPMLDREKVYEILMNVFRECKVDPPEDCHQYFEKQEAGSGKMSDSSF